MTRRKTGSIWKSLLLFITIIGPGVITASIDNDASGITTYSVAGARYGHMLLWTLIPTTIALVVIQEMVARTEITKEGTMRSRRITVTVIMMMLVSSSSCIFWSSRRICA